MKTVYVNVTAKTYILPQKCKAHGSLEGLTEELQPAAQASRYLLSLAKGAWTTNELRWQRLCWERCINSMCQAF